jgi:glucuronate isomerase
MNLQFLKQVKVLYHWSHLELQRYFFFGIDETVNLKSPPQFMIGDLKKTRIRYSRSTKKMNVEVICTTDDYWMIYPPPKIANSSLKLLAITYISVDKC